MCASAIKPAPTSATLTMPASKDSFAYSTFHRKDAKARRTTWNSKNAKEREKHESAPRVNLSFSSSSSCLRGSIVFLWVFAVKFIVSEYQALQLTEYRYLT